MDKVSNYSLNGYSFILLIIICVGVNFMNLASAEDVRESNLQDRKTTPKIKYSKITDAEIEADIKALDASAKSPDTKSINTKVFNTKLGEISEKFVKALQEKNTKQFYQNLNVDAIVTTSLNGAIQKLDDLSVARDDIIRGIVAMPTILISKIGQRGEIKYLRLVKRDNSYRGLVRIKFNNGELSYLELVAEKDKDGEIKIIDYYDLMLGRSYTTIVSQMLTQKRNKTKETDKIVMLSTEPLTFQARYAKTIHYYQKGKFKKAIDSLQRLPAKFKASRDMLLLRVQIAKVTNRNAYREALVLLENKFSTAPDLGLLLSDHYYFSKQFPIALKSIVNFSDYIGGDIALENLQIKILIGQQQFKQAIELGVAAMKEDDSYQDIYWLMLKAYLQTYNYQQVSETLDALIDKFNVKFDLESFHRDPFYREYGFSRQFRSWKEKRLSKLSSTQKQVKQN